jgi:hypothetical protein
VILLRDPNAPDVAVITFRANIVSLVSSRLYLFTFNSVFLWDMNPGLVSKDFVIL